MDKRKRNFIAVSSVTVFASLGICFGALFANSQSNFFQAKVLPGTRTFTLDLSTGHEFTDGVAMENASNENAGNYQVQFKLTQVSEAADSMSIQNNKTRVRQGDSIENVNKLSGVTTIRVNGGSGNYKLFAGYSKDNMFEFLQAESSSGDRIFNDIPNMNYFKLVGKYDNYTCDISSIEFTYTVADAGVCEYGESANFSDVTVYDGEYVKNTNTVVVNGSAATINEVEYNFAGILYDDGALYSRGTSDNVLLKFADANHLTVVDYVDKYSSRNGEYVKATPATAIAMSVNGSPVSANTSSTRYEMNVGDTFNFAATSDAIPAEDVNISLVDETGVETDALVGTYSPKSTITVEDIYGTWNDGDSFELTVNPIVVTKDSNGYHIAYSDVATSDYEGTNGTFDGTRNGDSLSFEEGCLTITIDTDEKEISFMYVDDDNGVYAMGDVAYNFAAASLATAIFNNGVVRAYNAGNFYLECTTSNSITAKFYVSVVAYVPATVSVTPNSVELEEGDTYQIVATVNDDATNKSLTYTSDSTSVATVSATGSVTAKKEGTAHITVETVDGNIATLTVTVTAPASVEYTFEDDYTVSYTVTFVSGTSITISDGSTDYVFEYDSSEGKYIYTEDSSVSVYIRNGGGAMFLEYEDDGSVLFDYGVIAVFGGSIELTEI